MAPFYGWGSPVSGLQSHRKKTVYFLPLSLGIHSTHVIELGRVKGWVDLGATQWFQTRNPRNMNPAP